MSKRTDQDLIADILEAINRILKYTEKISAEDFWEDFKTQDAVARNLEIIGEATKNVSGGTKKRYQKIPWKSLAGLRDRLIHHYFGVNLDIVWSIVRDELPELAKQIKLI